MVRLMINIDVPDVDAGARFYTAALGLTIGRRLGPDAIELLGAEAPIYLLAKPAGSAPFAGAIARRDYARHWSPVHLDVAVDDLEAAVARAEAAGARREGEIGEAAWGRIALCADPFGNGFCLLQLSARGYDAITTG